jgi:multicomponent Na+:H+ antiporter subunit D
MNLDLPPFAFLLLGGLVLPVFPTRLRAIASLLFPALALAAVWTLPDGAASSTQLFQYEIILYRVDSLSRVFGVVMALITLIGGVYAFHVQDTAERVAALLYASGALAVVFAGDFLLLLLAWELMAVASTYLIWARRSTESLRAGMRYLLVHLFGGALLLAGIAVHFHTTGSLTLQGFAPGESIAAWVILFAVAINAAIPPLHAWLGDAYPKATVTGAIFLSALTTKSAVYVLARLFPGWHILMYLGVIMALYGVLYAVLVNDIREILAYHIISQVGYMVAGVGIGTTLAINGTAAHAFSHILYKALLFMGAGVVLYTTGRSKLSELGGLWKYMPVAVSLYMVGAFSISGFPLFNGFISKSIIIEAAGEEGHYIVELLLLLASVGTFLHTGLKLPYWTWFGPARPLEPARGIPLNMLLAMGALAVLCTFFGVYPQLLYQWLPNPMEYHPYSLSHIGEATQLLTFTFVAFWLMRLQVKGQSQIALDVDWVYRRPAPFVGRLLVKAVNRVFEIAAIQAERLTTVAACIGTNPLGTWQQFRLPSRAFDPDADRPPVGNGIVITLVLVILVTLAVILPN